MYQKGFYNFQLRTLTPEQVDLVKDLMVQSFNETIKLDNEAGQEYFALFTLGALNEK